MKNVAFTPFCLRMSRICGVQSALGPSSNVSATLPGIQPERRMTYEVGILVKVSDVINRLVLSVSNVRAPLVGSAAMSSISPSPSMSTSLPGTIVFSSALGMPAP